jgi:hypothetical protein
VRTADLEADGSSACELYRKALALFEPIAAAGGLPADRRPDFDRAKGRAAACVSR